MYRNRRVTDICRPSAFGFWAVIFLGAVTLSGCKTSQVTTNSGGSTKGGQAGDNSAQSSYVKDVAAFRMKVAPSNAYESYQIHSQQFMEPTKSTSDVLSRDLINNAMSYKLTVLREERERMTEAMGYRILIFSSSSVQDAENQAVKLEEFLAADGNTYKVPVEYLAPNYVVKYGSFVSRLKAYEMYNRLKVDFPQAVIVPERVKIQK